MSALRANVAELLPLPALEATKKLDDLERKFIKAEIQPYVERNLIGKKDRISSFTIVGEGFAKTITWSICEGVECRGCEGSKYLRSNIGTRVDCPDCWGEGVMDGDERELTTDYDGRAAQ